MRTTVLISSLVLFLSIAVYTVLLVYPPLSPVHDKLHRSAILFERFSAGTLDLLFPRPDVYFFPQSDVLDPHENNKYKLPKRKGQTWPVLEVHRARADFGPDNSLLAAQRAIALGAQMLEIDVIKSLDNQIIVTHENKLRSWTTNGTGSVKDSNYFGHMESLTIKHDPADVQHVKDVRVARLNEFFDLILEEGHEHLYLDVDVKTIYSNIDLFQHLSALVESYPDYETRLLPRLTLTLWHSSQLEAAKSRAPRIKRYAGLYSLLKAYVHFGGTEVAGYSISFSRLISMPSRIVDDFVERVRREGKDLVVFNINTEEEMRAARALGADVICTDNSRGYLGLMEREKGDSMEDGEWIRAREHQHFWQLCYHFVRAVVEYVGDHLWKALDRRTPDFSI